MPYIATKPGTAFRTFTDKDTFSGDGSTTTFDMQFAIAEAGQNDLEVFVGGTRQLPGTAFTLGVDGNGDYKRITFTSAPASGTNNVVVLNPGTVKGGFASVEDNAITASKLNTNAFTGHTELTEAPADDDVLTLFDTSAGTIKKIQNSNLVGTALITGKSALGEGAASDDLILMSDTSDSGALKKVTQTNFLNFPSVTGVSPTNVTTGDGTGNHTFTITGTGFIGATANLINDSGSSVSFDSQTVNSATQITAVIAKSNLPSSGEPYDVRVAAVSGLAGTLDNQINIDAAPEFQDAAGSLGTFNALTAITPITVEAHDPESAGQVGFEIISGSLPGGLSGATTSSGFVISGTPSSVNSSTTSNFTLRANDAASNTSTRAFTITVNPVNYFGDGSDGALDTTP